MQLLLLSLFTTLGSLPISFNFALSFPCIEQEYLLTNTATGTRGTKQDTCRPQHSPGHTRLLALRAGSKPSSCSCSNIEVKNISLPLSNRNTLEKQASKQNYNFKDAHTLSTEFHA